ncbi:hypothetical protein [Mycobacterium asiaticum]|uniref:hypothetical protein n=1 Tax=Mycobacterium asiaticum TaxID=1790 RepID=UPI000B1D3027|nr:hypothetical protein [Mycobacterium asiaticum]
MLKRVLLSAPSRPGIERRPSRLIWVGAVLTGAAVCFGGGAVPTLTEGATVLTATPEDPCLLNHTCGEETPGAVEELEAYCNNMREQGVFWIPECARFN